MADSTGISGITGAPLTDWQHVEQSIAVILTTPPGSRVMRREFGSNIRDLIDAKMVQRNVLAVYSAAAVAISRWEPRFRVTSASVSKLTAGGVTALEIFGTYFPRGHLGDYSIAQDASTRVAFVGALQ
ncbi:baseplate assembly protein [Mesorhizobium sp. B2-5-9]|uniref:GPW/gp25 family protein n=1 Tax=Mesorhizobium sp. B2-5-9 TaxID=2589921 RepID=UPI00112C9997|nr:GPW/gp25 family protein [Mesorhizobium sp. B2-5-9]TPK15168.1 baseplate assembly protein [Mesorhizobium sp. B2-5-9]